MNALLIWVGLPGAAALAIYALRRYEVRTHLAGIGLCLLLSWLAWRAPIGAPIAPPAGLSSFLPTLRIEPNAILLGGSFRMDNSLRPALSMLYLSAAFWFGGGYAARTHRLFIPVGLAIAALMSATLSAGQNSTAALLIELVALLCVPLLSSPGEKMRRGVLRFIAYQTGGVCLILFAEAAISALTAASASAGTLDTAQSPEMVSAVFILLLGFSLLLAVAPFHTWMPMLAEEGNPYAALFVFYVIPAAVGILALRLLSRFAAAGLTPTLVTMMQYAGALMAVAGGLSAALERHLGRIAGFSALTLVGMNLLALSLNDEVGRVTPVAGIFFALLAPQATGLAVWGLALSLLNRHLDDLRFHSAQGAAHSLPFVAAGLAAANLSLAGLPLLAGFPVYIALWVQLGARSLPAVLLSLAGALGLLIAGLRSLAVLILLPEPPEAPPGEAALASPAPLWRSSETRMQVALLCLGLAALLLAGLFPQLYLPTLTNMAIQLFE